MLVCTKCQQSKSVDKFHAKTNGGHSSWCKACVSLYKKQRYVDKKRAYVPSTGNCYCKSCQTWYLAGNFAVNPGNSSGRMSYCRVCRTCRAQGYHVIDSQTKRRRWMTAADYASLLREQDGLCVLCKQPESTERNGKLIRLSVDHDHATGIVRGLLCIRCNMIMQQHADKEFFYRAAQYLDNQVVL